MKLNKSLAILACGALVFASCQDDILDGKGAPAKVGDEIVFGGSLVVENVGHAKTRTVYGDKGETGTEIKWYEGDAVRIYCEAAQNGTAGSTQHYCDYSVTDYIEAPKYDANGAITNGAESNPYGGGYTQKHSSDLISASEGLGFYWGTGEHIFYGVYPSPGMLNKEEDDAVAREALSIENNKITAYLPNLQRPVQFVDPKVSTTEKTTDKDGEEVFEKYYTIHPSMRYAYMVAHETVSAPTQGVTLTFEPIVTAVEMTIENTGSAPIEGVSLISLSSANVICGDFTAEISSKTITNTSTDPSYKTISIPVSKEGSTIDLNPGDKITFTAFMILNTNLASIDVTLVYANGVATKKATLKGTEVDIVQAKKKNFISKVGASFSQSVASVELDKWMASISQTTNNANTPISLLSIPAAGGAASGHTTNWATNETYLEQKLGIDELWSQGIRCFEFTLDVNSEGNANLGDSYVYCNTVQSTLTLRDAVQKVKTKLLANPTEFAMVIITYQQNGGWDQRSLTDNSGGGVTYNRKPATFMTQLNNFWEEVSATADGNWPSKSEITVDGQKTIPTGTALYSPSMTLANARGKLFCIARPTSEYEDSYIVLTKGSANKITATSYATLPTASITNANILVVNGWGAMKDKWERRGYTASAFYRGSGNDAWNTISASLKTSVGDNGKPGRPFDVSTKENDTQNTISDSYIDDLLADKKLTPNFSYTVSTSSGNASFNAWAQEWARVSDITGSFFKHYEENDTTKKRDFFWANSTNEKFANVQETFDKALSDQTGSTLYINSLCGYFIDKSILNSYLPNSLSEMSAYWNAGLFGLGSGYYYRDLSGASRVAGMSGNISRFAQWMNNKFYNYLLTKDLGGKSTGIIMMDRVSDNATENPAGYYIPRIILANNPFKEQAVAADPSAIGLDVFEAQDGPATKTRSNGGFTVTWE
ncbi:MAG: hypothetical protein IJZ68_11555 [Bacteroidaceae bacterium]|nr:hypothetical protein [Bacteroidaceae bacterium]